MLAETLERIALDAPLQDAAPLVARPVHLPAAGSLSREQIEAFERHLIDLPQVEIPVVHEFAPGLYMRTITIPADTLMTGKVHRHAHMSVMVSGDMTLDTETGRRRITGCHRFVAPPGTKRIGYAHAETVWLTVHANPHDIRDIEELEAFLVEPWPPVPQIGGTQ